MFSHITLIIVITLTSFSHSSVAGGSTIKKHLLSVEDMINFTEIGDPETVGWIDYSKKTASFSPSRKRVAIVIRRGNANNETMVGKLLVYETDKLFQDATHIIVAEYASTTNFQPIALVQWIDDNTITFAGTDGEEPTQIYSADLKTGKVKPLSNEPTGIKWYDFSATGDRLVTFSHLPGPSSPAKDQECIKHACRVTATRFHDAIHGGLQLRSVYDGVMSVYNRLTGIRKQIPRPEEVSYCSAELAGGLSPDGRYGLRLCQLDKWPEWWTEYTFDDNQTREQLLRKNENFATQYFLVDMETGASWPATGSVQPFTQSDPLWINDGHQVILAGALEPLVGTEGAERLSRASEWGVLILDIKSGKLESIGKFDATVVHVGKAKWNADSKTLTVATQDKDRTALPLLSWHRKKGIWTAIEPIEGASEVDPLLVQLVLRQTPNERPMVYAHNPVTGTDKLVLDPNSWMDSIKLGRVEEVNWDIGGNRQWHGMLYFPPDYKPGVRYPLVIQTHGIRKGEFSLSGYVRNFAAQPLAARGIMVLQVFEVLFGKVATPDEWPTVQVGYETAIDYLDTRHLIDRTRVGIVGWSRSGTWVSYLLTHSDYPIAATAYTESGDFGWWYYMIQGTPAELDGNYGASPFGSGLEQWLEMSPSFSMDRIQTPMLMWSRADLLLWDMYAGLRKLDKPVEFWQLSKPEHDVFKIGQRLKTNHLLVDWFDFWLNDNEDETPEKADQYVRWRELRGQHKRDLARPRPPLLDWTSTTRK